MTTNILLLTITAYYNPHHNLAANGKLPINNLTVAASRNIPLGTHIFIEGVGERIVTDRLNKRFNDRIDLYFDSKQQCLKWGKQQRKVTLIK